MKPLNPIRHFHLIWPAAVAIGVAVGAGVIMEGFREKVDKSRQAQVQLAQLDAATHELQALDWRALAERRVPPDASAVFAEVNAETRDSVATLTRVGERQVSNGVAGAFLRYRTAVERELSLVASGRIAAARRFDARVVDPAFDRVHAVLDSAAASLRPRVADNARRSEVGSVLVLAAAALSWMLLVQRFVRRRRQVVQLAVREEGERRLRALAENSSDIVAVTDPHGSIRYLSGPLQRTLAREARDLEGGPLLDLVHPDDRDRARELLSVKLGHVDSGDLRFSTGDESGWKILETFASNRSGDSAIGGIVFNLHDVTARRALEAQLLQAQKLEAVGRLAGGIAHDFNNILMSIGGSADLLVEREPSLREREEIRGISDATTHATALTQQLLAFSRRQALQPKVFDPRTVVTRLEPMLRRVMREDRELLIRCSDGVGHVRADPVQIEQVLLNLVVNACDALGAGGSVTLEVDQDDTDAVLRVSDTGSGMDEATLGQAFDPFFTTKGPKGTGLGLATVYGIVEQSGGSIAVESEPGVGTTFSIHLPLVDDPPDEAAPQRLVPARRTDARTVLLVEDDPRVRDLLARMLEVGRHTVLAAASGAEALEIAGRARGAIDLVVTDVVMPGIQGRELADRLTEVLPGLKVLFISGYTEDTLVTAGPSQSRRFLPKPFGHDELLAAVAALLDGGAALSETA
jgi:two-component system cell cycle sensor histidine kinase/response regulator CckA